MTTTIQPFQPMATRIKTRLKQFSHKQNMNTLTQLMKRPNMTVKKSLLENIQFIDISKLKKNEFINVSNMKCAKSNGKVQKTYKGKEIKKKIQPQPTERKEFYPKLSKRNFKQKEIKLKHKHSYKIIGTMNKRKRGIPHYYAEIKSLPSIEPRKSPTLQELVQCADEDLNDEDFLEILTCPSPVWWEDHEEDSSEEDITENMDEGYKEILNDLENHSQKLNATNISSENDILRNNDKYKGKRTKLEHILGNIKLKTLRTRGFEISDDINPISNRYGSDRKSLNSDTIHENSDTKSKDSSLNSDNTIEDSDEINVSPNVNNISDICGNFDRNSNSDKSDRERKSSLGGVSDTSINEDLLKHLENIEIPVKNENDQNGNGHNENDQNGNGHNENGQSNGHNKNDQNGNGHNENYQINGNCRTIYELNDNEQPHDIDGNLEVNKDKIANIKIESLDKNNTKDAKVKKRPDKSKLMPTRKSKRKSPNKMKYYQDFEVFHEIKRKRKSEDDIELNRVRNILETSNLVPTVLPTLKKNPCSKKGVKQSDSISDTDIKYLDVFDDKLNKMDECVTVYQILPTQPEEIDVEDQIVANLLSKERFKQNTKNNETNQEEEMVNKKNKSKEFSKPVKKDVNNKKLASKNSKYCHNCSSIFDSDNCQYCVIKSKRKTQSL